MSTNQSSVADRFHDGAQHPPTDAKGRDQLLTVREVADLLHVPASWVYAHIRERCADRIPGFRVGKYWRFSERDVTAWLRAKRTKD